ncbi:MAG: hypothetical protein HY783_05275 [Chloroflexi bacterium]|nr:hypothetical protein [Chloroflexota bacterium]
MQLRSYAAILMKRGWLVVLMALAGLLGAAALTRVQVPIYRSSIRLLVVPARYELGVSLAGKNLLGQLSLELQSPNLAEEVSQGLRLDVPALALLSHTRVSNEEDKYVINLSVDNPDPERAQMIASAWARAFVDRYNARSLEVDRRDRVDVEIYDKATPAELNRPKLLTNVVVATLGGLLLGIFLAFGLEYLDDTLKAPEDVERYVGLTTLGAIPLAVEKD